MNAPRTAAQTAGAMQAASLSNSASTSALLRSVSSHGWSDAAGKLLLIVAAALLLLFLCLCTILYVNRALLLLYCCFTAARIALCTSLSQYEQH